MYCLLAQGKPVLMAKGRNNVQGGFSELRSRPPNGFAVNGHYATIFLRQALGEFYKKISKLFSFESTKKSPQGIVGGSPVRIGKVFAQPVQLKVAELFNGIPRVTTANYRWKRQKEYFF